MGRLDIQLRRLTRHTTKTSLLTGANEIVRLGQPGQNWKFGVAEICQFPGKCGVTEICAFQTGSGKLEICA